MEKHWIKSPLSNKYAGAISFVRNLQMQGVVTSAKVIISSVGLYELLINEKKVGNRVLTPGFTSYNKRGIQYQEYEIADYLLKDNTICITVAPGWAIGHIGYAGNAEIYADHVSACAKFVVTYQDGKEETIFTDATWGSASWSFRLFGRSGCWALSFSGNVGLRARIFRRILPPPQKLLAEKGSSLWNCIDACPL